jgi:hypothetical protein
LIKTIIRLFAIFLAISALPEIGYAQPQLVASDGYLPLNSLLPSRNTAIGNSPVSGPVIIWLRPRPDFQSDLYIAHKNGTWHSEQDGVFFTEGLTLWTGKDSASFIFYSFGNLLYFTSGDTLISRACPGMPAMDSLGCFHVFYGDTSGLIYKFSRDTLRTFEVIDTIFTDYYPIGIFASPDRGKIALFFRDYFTLDKIAGDAGQPLNLDSSVSFDFDWGIDEFAIDNDANAFISYHQLGEVTWERFVWSEQYGSRRLYDLNGMEQTAFIFQYAFCPSRNVILGIESRINSNDNLTDLSFSTDGGDTWSLSLIQPEWGNASSPRFIADTLFLATQSTDSFRVYYQAIPVDDIVANSVGINGEESPLPAEISLINYPNPFNAHTTIGFNLPKAGKVMLAIYDIAGREIKELVEGYYQAGPHSVVWNGMNEGNRPVASGVYFCKLSVDDKEDIRKLLLLK